MLAVSLLRGLFPQHLFCRRKHSSGSGIRLMWTAGIRRQLALDALRRAIFAYLFAKSQHGRWILYVTHPKVDSRLIESELAYLELHPDESPSAGGQSAPYVDPVDFYRKSRQLAEQMVEQQQQQQHHLGKVYRCFCAQNLQSSIIDNQYITCWNNCHQMSPELSQKLSRHRRSMIRLKCSGPLKNDIVLVDVNGAPTICYKNALRQRNMCVTHVITDTMRQLVYNRIYKAIGMEQHPKHLAIGRLILKNHGKLCTAHNPENYFSYYRNLLYSPVPLLNWLVDGYGIRDYNSTQLYSLEELVDRFEPTLCTRQEFAVVDLERLLMFDKLYHNEKKNKIGQFFFRIGENNFV